MQSGFPDSIRMRKGDYIVSDYGKTQIESLHELYWIYRSNRTEENLRVTWGLLLPLARTTRIERENALINFDLYLEVREQKLWPQWINPALVTKRIRTRQSRKKSMNE